MSYTETDALLHVGCTADDRRATEPGGSVASASNRARPTVQEDGRRATGATQQAPEYPKSAKARWRQRKRQQAAIEHARALKAAKKPEQRFLRKVLLKKPLYVHQDDSRLFRYPELRTAQGK